MGLNWILCTRCNTVDGWIERTSFTGRKRAPGRCVEHTEGIARCEICAAETRLVQQHTGFDKKGRAVSRPGPEAGGPWELMPVGQAELIDAVRGAGRAWMKETEVYACAACAAALRVAQQIAFDAVAEKRTGLRKGERLTPPPKQGETVPGEATR